MKNDAVAVQGGNVLWIPGQGILEITKRPLVEVQGTKVELAQCDHGFRVLGHEANGFRHRLDRFRIPGFLQQPVSPVEQELGKVRMPFDVIRGLLEPSGFPGQIERQR